MILSNNISTLSEAEISHESASTQSTWILSGISKITELTLDLFKNNYKLFAQKLVDVETDLVIRAILLKNNEVILNYSIRIQGTDNIHDATIAATNKVCNLFLGFALKGDTLVCSLGAGHNSVCTSITRNVHVSNFIKTLNLIKDKTGLYIFITASKYDWLEYAGGNTTYEDLFVTPNKKVINLTIQNHLVNTWCTEWNGLKGHKQTKYWFTMPDPYLASKLLNLSRENLGKCVQFLTGHGWWNKHLKLANLSNTSECRLCYEDDESPIHIFSECVAMVTTRQELFNSSYPSQELGRALLCQIVELALIDSVRELMDIDHNHSNVSSTE